MAYVLGKMPEPKRQAWLQKVWTKANSLADPTARLALLNLLLLSQRLPNELILALSVHPDLDLKHRLKLFSQEGVTKEQVAAWWLLWDPTGKALSVLIGDFITFTNFQVEKIPDSYLGQVLGSCSFFSSTDLFENLEPVRRALCLQQLGAELATADPSRTTSILTSLYFLGDLLTTADLALWPKESLKKLLLDDAREIRIKAQSSMALRDKPKVR